NEQPFDLLKESPPERRDGVVVGMIVGCDETKRHRVISRTLQLAARKNPRRVAINQNAQQHPRVVGRRTRAAITAAHRAKVHRSPPPRTVPDASPVATRLPTAAE